MVETQRLNDTTLSPSVQCWTELRIAGQTPERRSYHSSFSYNGKLYVFGGLDIQKGCLETLYELDLNSIACLENESIEER